MTRHRRSSLYGAGITEDCFLLIFNTHFSFNRATAVRRLTFFVLPENIFWNRCMRYAGKAFWVSICPWRVRLCFVVFFSKSLIIHVAHSLGVYVIELTTFTRNWKKYSYWDALKDTHVYWIHRKTSPFKSRVYQKLRSLCKLCLSRSSSPKKIPVNVSRTFVWDELGQRSKVRVITRLFMNTGKQTDHPSRRSIG